jgi:hypothetical protein
MVAVGVALALALGVMVAVAVADGEEAEGDGQGLGESDEGLGLGLFDSPGMMLGRSLGMPPGRPGCDELGLELGDGLSVDDGQASAAEANEPPTVMAAGSATTAPAHSAPAAVTTAVRRKRDAMWQTTFSSRTGPVRPYPASWPARVWFVEDGFRRRLAFSACPTTVCACSGSSRA